MDEALVEAVREFPILWKFGHNNYKDSGARENAWKEVAKKTGLTVEECQKKWKNMRDRFVKEHKKVTDVRSGDPGPAYKSGWKLYQLLTFLIDSIRHRVTSSNFSPVESSAEESIIEDVESPLTDDPPTSSSTSMDNSATSVDNSASTTSPTAGPTVTVTTLSSSLDSGKPPSKRKKDKDTEVDEAILNSLKDLQGRRQNREAKDQEALFGEQVAGTLRRLPVRQREMVKIKISSLLFDAEFPEET